MIAEVAGIVGVVVGALSTVTLVIDTAAGRAAPPRASWGVWTGTSAIGTAAAYAAFGGVGATVSAAVFIRCVSVFVATFIPGWRGIPVTAEPYSATQRRLDRTCLTVCGIVAAGWGAAEAVNRFGGVDADTMHTLTIVALLAAIATDGVAGVPTAYHAWHGEEQLPPWVLGLVNPTIGLLLVRERTAAALSWPLWELTICTAIGAIVLARRHVVRRSARVAVAVGATAWWAAAMVYGLVLVPAPAAVPIAAASPAALPAVVPGPALAGPAADPPTVAVSAAIPSVRDVIPVDPTPGYIELTPNGRQAWIAHRDTGVVSVLDVTSGRIVGRLRIPAGPPQFIAFCPDGRSAYVSVYTMANKQADPSRPHVVAVLDTATIDQVAEIPVGQRPFASDCSADGRTLAVPSHDDALVDFIDTATNTIRERIPVLPNPHWICHTPDGRWWTANHESNVVTRVDNVTYAAKTIPLTAPGVRPGRSPHSIAASPDGGRLAVVTFDSDQVWILDARTETVIRAVDTAGRGPQDVAWAPDGGHLYTTDVDGDDVSVIDPNRGAVTAYPPTGDGPVSVACSADGRTAYVANLNSSTVTVLDTAQPAER